MAGVREKRERIRENTTHDFHDEEYGRNDKRSAQPTGGCPVIELSRCLAYPGVVRVAVVAVPVMVAGPV